MAFSGTYHFPKWNPQNQLVIAQACVVMRRQVESTSQDHQTIPTDVYWW
jgi:hypothetical protein